MATGEPASLADGRLDQDEATVKLKQIRIAGVRFVVSPDGDYVTSYNDETWEKIDTVPLACALGWAKALVVTLQYSEVPE